ncbi:MAG: hypothetical protein ABII82_01965 [Verrucomicrobiota bacterium]
MASRSPLQAQSVTVGGRSFFTKAADGVHPEYAKRWRQWRFNELSYLGGIDYLFPDLTTDWVVPAYSDGGGADEPREIECLASRTLYSFLFPFARESDWQHHQRLAQASYRNIVAPGVDLLASFVLGQPIRRDPGSVSWLAEMWAEHGDMDGRGSDATEFMGEGLRGALTFGVYHAIPDWPRLPAESEVAAGAISLATQRAENQRPYVRWVSPLQIPAWCETHRRLLGVKILEPDTRHDSEDPWGLRARPPLSVIWTEERWDRYDSAGVHIDGAEHRYGGVPIETLYARRAPGSPLMWGVTPVDDVARIGQRVFNLESEIQALCNAQWPFLAVFGGGALSKLDLGTSDAFDLPKDGTLPAWVSPPAENIAALRAEVVEQVQAARIRFGLGRGQAEQSTEARSGVALAYESSERTVLVTTLAANAADFERRLGRRIACVVNDGNADSFDGSVAYPETYDVETLGEKIAAVKELVALPIPDQAREAILDAVWQSRLGHMPPADREVLIAAVKKQRASRGSGEAAGRSAMPELPERDADARRAPVETD